MKRIYDENNNLVIVPNNLSEAQRSGDEPFMYRYKKYFLTNSGRNCVSKNSAMKFSLGGVSMNKLFDLTQTDFESMSINNPTADNNYLSQLSQSTEIPEDFLKQLFDETDDDIDYDIDYETDNLSSTVSNPATTTYSQTTHLSTPISEMPLNWLSTGRKDQNERYAALNDDTKGLINLLYSKGYQFKITSTTRKPEDNVGKYSKTSKHNSGQAFDLVPTNNDFQGFYEAIKSDPEISEYMNTHNFGVVREVSKEALAKTGGTGPHYHFGKGEGMQWKDMPYKQTGGTIDADDFYNSEDTWEDAYTLTKFPLNTAYKNTGTVDNPYFDEEVTNMSYSTFTPDKITVNKVNDTTPPAQDYGGANIDKYGNTNVTAQSMNYKIVGDANEAQTNALKILQKFIPDNDTATALMIQLYGESNLNPQAVNKSSNAQGVGQWIPSNHQAVLSYVNKKYGTQYKTITEIPLDQQLDAAAHWYYSGSKNKSSIDSAQGMFNKVDMFIRQGLGPGIVTQGSYTNKDGVTYNNDENGFLRYATDTGNNPQQYTKWAEYVGAKIRRSGYNYTADI